MAYESSLLTPDSYYAPEDPDPNDGAALYMGPTARWKPRVRPGGQPIATGGGQGMSSSNAAATKAIYGNINNQALASSPAAYQTPSPDEYIGTNAPPPAHTPETSPNRGGFNQAEGLSGPDYSEGDDLRAQAAKLQHPSWWKKLVNGDEGLNRDALFKEQLAQYADLAAERKFRWQHPEAFVDKSPKLQPVNAGQGLWDANKGAWAVPPTDKPTKPATVHQFASGGRLWGRADDSTTAVPITAPTEGVGPTEDGEGFGRAIQMTADDKTFAEKGLQSQVYQDKDGVSWERVFDPNTGKSQVRRLDALPAGATPPGKGGKSAAAGKPDWTPKDLEKVATRISGIRSSAAATSDPDRIDAAEKRVTQILNSAGLVEDDTTGELSPRPQGQPAKPKRSFDPANPPNGTIRKDRTAGDKEVFLRGKWQPFTGNKGPK